MDSRTIGMAEVASRYQFKAVYAVVGAFVAALGAGAISIGFNSGAEAKTPGKTYCFHRKCHRVRTLAETRRAIGAPQVVIASHYDDPRRDRYNPSNLTSSGEWFRADRPDNAASPIWPNGTKLLLWNPANKRTAVVRINNAGPYWGNRTLDVSRATADKLGFMGQGVAKLVTKVIEAPTVEEATYKRGRTYAPVPGYVGVFESIDIALLGVTRSITRALMGEAVRVAAGRDPSPRIARPTLVASADSKPMSRRERRLAARQKARSAPLAAASVVAAAPQRTSPDPVTNTIIAATTGLRLALAAPAELVAAAGAASTAARAVASSRTTSVREARMAARQARLERRRAARAQQVAKLAAARTAKRPARRPTRIAANTSRSADRDNARQVRMTAASARSAAELRQAARTRRADLDDDDDDRPSRSARRRGGRDERSSSADQPRRPITGRSRFVAVRCLAWPRPCDFPSAIRARERAASSGSGRASASSRRFASSGKRR
jgi:rare lipoprotein A